MVRKAVRAGSSLEGSTRWDTRGWLYSTMWIWHPEETKNLVGFYLISSTSNPRPLCTVSYNMYSPSNFNIHLALNVYLIVDIWHMRDWLIEGGDLKNIIKNPRWFCILSNSNVLLWNLLIRLGFICGFFFHVEFGF